MEVWCLSRGDPCRALCVATISAMTISSSAIWQRLECTTTRRTELAQLASGYIALVTELDPRGKPIMQTMTFCFDPASLVNQPPA